MFINLIEISVILFIAIHSISSIARGKYGVLIDSDNFLTIIIFEKLVI